jgi:hypothetical protein
MARFRVLLRRSGGRHAEVRSVPRPGSGEWWSCPMRWDASSGIEPAVSRVVDGLIERRVPERSDRRGGRSARLGRGWHVERALLARADLRDRPLARTTTRRPAWRLWSSREGRGSRGVDVHRSFREGPDWPVQPRPSGDASCSSPAVAVVASCPVVRGGAPALLGQRALARSSGRCPASLRRSGFDRAWGRGQAASSGRA